MPIPCKDDAPFHMEMARHYQRIAMIEAKQEKTIVQIISSEKSWFESEALRQLHKTAELVGMKAAIGLPDLHPGKGSPVGAAILTSEMATMSIPYLIKNNVHIRSKYCI